MERKVVFSFKKKSLLVVGIQYHVISDRLVNFTIVRAIDEPVNGFDDDDIAFNLLNGKGDVVRTFDEAHILADGQMFISDNPNDILNGNPLKYNIKTHDYHYTVEDFDALYGIINNEMVKTVSEILTGTFIDHEEFVFDDNE